MSETNPYNEARTRWQRLAETATLAADEAKRAGEQAVAEMDLEAAIEAFARWRTIMERVLPEIDRARTRALNSNFTYIHGGGRR